MKVRSRALWEATRADLTADGVIGRQFLEFVDLWAAQAEEFIVILNNDLAPATALNRALPLIEEGLGRCPAHFMGQMLAVLATHWVYGGDNLMDTLTPIERRLVEDLTLLKVTEQQQSAEQARPLALGVRGENQ